jgi:outer membrane protein OmpA-like peptidoglycan-associated protein
MSAFFAQKETRIEAKRLRQAEERRKSAKASYKLKAASFESGSDILSLDAVENIKVLAQAIKEDTYQRITVEGHTDSTGTDELNNSLSDKRAMAVYSELIRNGVDIDRLQIVGFGSKMPISDNLTANGKAQNRRVEIFIE